ncbi:MAG TPA: ribonuclease HII [Paenalcaligenes sp.]|nr:ribonuclease HII [Paenalcaligenes sp.]
MPLFQQVVEHIAGVDEAGRGPLAGPVFAAAVILNPSRPIEGLMDSKKLSAQRREELATIIRAHAFSWCVAQASTVEIDNINILQATLLAMRRAVHGLDLNPDQVIIDGRNIPEGLGIDAIAVVKADQDYAQVAAASILAKTARDRWCLALDEKYPEYGFAQHKGYGTALHQERLKEFGPCPEHRRSFAPVRRLLKHPQRIG